MKPIWLLLPLFLVVVHSCKEENQPPTCEITSPSNASEITVGDTIPISINAVDPEGGALDVTIYINEEVVQTMNVPPYVYEWYTEGEEEGLFSIKATALDFDNADASDEHVISLETQALPPLANFSCTPESGDDPLTVFFTDESEHDPLTWLWDFGDSQTSSQRNPTHEYTDPGVYSVSLIVENVEGADTIVKTDAITVAWTGNAPIVVCDISPTEGPAPLFVGCQDFSQNHPTSWLWDFGDGATSTERNVGHTYTEPGTYIITFKVSNPAGSDSTSQEIIVGEEVFAPIPAFTASPTSGPVPLTVQFEGEVEHYYYFLAWEFGDGNSIEGDDLNPTYTYNEPGIYTVRFYAQSDEGTNYEEKVDYIEVFDTYEPCPNTPTVTDIDGNEYNTVQIGGQCWMKENLKVTNYPNGEAIPFITEDSEWAALGQNNTDDAFCFYDNNTSSEYGALYSYAAAIADDWQRDNNDNQGICPDGWHLPTNQEWTTLKVSVGGSNVGGKLKKTGTEYWNMPNAGATNETNFTALGGGYRHWETGGSSHLKSNGVWWTATEYDDSNARSRHLFDYRSDLWEDYLEKSFGYSVRCLRND